MGFATSYVLVQDLSREMILRRLGARLGDPVEEPDNSRAPTTLGPTEHGWTVIADSPGDLCGAPELCQDLGRDTTVVTAFLEEHCMYSEANLYTAGRRVWKVSSDGEHDRTPGRSGIETEGVAPAQLDALIAEALREELANPGVDYQFEVPLHLVTKVTVGAIDGRYPWGEEPHRELIFGTPSD